MARRTPNSYFKMGDWNAICDYCGGTFKASELRPTWKGWMACSRDWEPRHPQDFVRGVPDSMTPPWIRPPLVPSFLFPAPVGGTNTSGIAGIAVAGLAICGTGNTTTVNSSAKAGVAIAGIAVAGRA